MQVHTLTSILVLLQVEDAKSKPSKKSRTTYSQEEKTKILEFVVQNDVSTAAAHFQMPKTTIRDMIRRDKQRAQVSLTCCMLTSTIMYLL